MSFLGNTSTSPFGASKLGGVFGGQTSTPQQQGATTTNLFGGTTPSGGTGTSSIFGGGTTNQFGFGGNTSTNGVGAFSGVFGSASKPATASTGLFGGTTTTMGFGSSQAAGTSVPFEAAEDTDVISKNGIQSQVRVKYQNITLMKQYKTFEKSLEELRLEDYQLNRHKKNTLGLFGTSGAAPSAPTPPAAGGGFFGSGVFGASNTATTTPTTSAFVLGGTSSRFGQQTTSSSAATTTGSAFGGTSLFGSQQNKPVGGLFGSGTGTGTTGAFGTTGGTSSTPFTFGTAATTASTQPTTNLFGQSTQQQQGTNSGFTFGQPSQPSTTSAFGTSSIFGGQTSQQQPTFGSFTQQQQQQQPTTTTNWFGNTSTTTATPAAKPLFGGTGSVFGSSSTSTSQPQNNSFFSVPTSTTTTSSTTPVFGGTGSGGTATIGLFGNTTQQQAQQQSKFFAFPSTNTTSSSFGGFGGTATAPQTTTPSFGFGSSAFQSQPQQPSTGIPGFQPTFGAPAQPSTGFNFSMTSQEQQQPYYPYINPVSNYYMPLYYAPGPVAFATTAYKDNPIFYNLLQNHPIPQSSSRKKREDGNSLENATLLPTASRRMRFSGSGPSAFGSFNLSKSPAVKKLTRYNTSKGSKQHNSLTKFKLFDGFEEEDFGVGINILSPKCSVKKLDLSALKHPLLQINLNHGDKDMGMAQRSQEILRRKEVELEASSSNSFEHSPLLQRTRKVRFNLPEDDRLREESDTGSVSVILPPEENRGLRRMGMMNGGGDAASSSSSVALVELGIRKEEEEDKGNSSVEKITIPGEKCGVINTRLDYWLKPGLRELDQMVDGQGYCVVIGLEIGRRQYGRIKFLCPVNIAGQNIDKLVHFRHKEVVVYPNDNDKPDLGQGLNVPAEIQLERVWPVDQDNNELIRDPDNAKLQQYEEKLRRACKRMKAEFVSYSGEEGLWVFRVTHF